MAVHHRHTGGRDSSHQTYARCSPFSFSIFCVRTQQKISNPQAKLSKWKDEPELRPPCCEDLFPDEIDHRVEQFVTSQMGETLRCRLKELEDAKCFC